MKIPASVVLIGSRAFYWTPLNRLEFEENSELRVIGSEAFAYCWNLTSIDLPNKLETIGELAFIENSYVNVTIPASVIELGGGAFACCYNLTSVNVEAGNTVYHDIDGIVYNLANTEIHIYPAGKAGEFYEVQTTTTSLMPWSFAGSVYLKNVMLPEPLTLIAEYAFA